MQGLSGPGYARAQGVQGLMGPQGNPEPAGFKRDKGNAGLTGLQGPVGVQINKGKFSRTSRTNRTTGL